MKIQNAITALSAALILVACGGGGGGDPKPQSTPSSATISFPLQSGYKARVASGSTDNFTVSGTCSGTATETTSTPSGATFEGTPGFSAAQTISTHLTNCTPSTNAATSTTYYDSNYSLLGSAFPGVEYSVIVGATLALPVTVKVGDTGSAGTSNVYSDSSKAVSTAQRIMSYVIEPDSSNTAIANLITKSYNTSHQLLFTQQARYRIAADGTLTPISIDVQYSTTSTNHLIYTKI